MATARPCGPVRATRKSTTKKPGCRPAPCGPGASAVDHQVLEPDSPLRKRADLDLTRLCQRLPAGPATIYCYVMSTVEQRQGTLVHCGSGPNIEGGLITLCTCKHLMRTYREVQPGAWIAGFSGSREESARGPARRNTLFYLTRVQHAFASQMELWRSPVVPEQTRRRKSSRDNRLGDLFEPRKGASDPYGIESYHTPIRGHAHAPEDEWPGGSWHKDILYMNRFGRRPALVVGHAEFSFVWTRPRLELSHALRRRTARFDSMHEFLAQLQNS